MWRSIQDTRCGSKHGAEARGARTPVTMSCAMSLKKEIYELLAEFNSNLVRREAIYEHKKGQVEKHQQQSHRLYSGQKR